MNMGLYILVATAAGGVVLLLLLFITSTVVIGEEGVGIVVRKFGKALPAGHLIALDQEAGYQADTLPPGWHFGYWPWQYKVIKTRITVVKQGKIALVLANDGAAIPSERILGREIACENFQNARAFLKNGGEKGRQLGILTAGKYRINVALFNIITAENAREYGMDIAELSVYRVEQDQVGIVTTLDGAPIDEGEIAGPLIEGHDNFQRAQSFVGQGGRRGLQEQVLLSGSWNLNPWFVSVEQVNMTEIPIGFVGIVISFVGKEHLDVSGVGFKYGNLVDPGHKGVWVTPLYAGKHPINTRVMRVARVPTTNIVLNWAKRTEAHSYDAKLSPITVRSSDGFAFNLDVAQIIHIGATDAPKVISRVGSLQNLVDHVLQPIVGNYFRNSAQTCTVLDFLGARSERQTEAASHIREALANYDVQAIDTLLGDITPPEELMETQTARKIAEERRQTYEIQRQAQMQRQELVRETSMADIQEEMVRSEQGVHIAGRQAEAAVKRAQGEAESTRLQAISEAHAIQTTGNARASAHEVGVKALGAQQYLALQLMKVIGEQQVRIVPDVSVQSGEQNGLVDGLLGMMLQQQTDVPLSKDEVLSIASE